MKNLEFPKKIHWVVAVFLAAAAFTLVTHGWSSELSQNWQRQSEELVWGRILQIQRGEFMEGGGFLGRYADGPEIEGQMDYFLSGETPQGEWRAYSHQSGLQGTLYGIVNLILCVIIPQSNIRLFMLYFINAALYVAMMLFLCRWIWQKVGLTAAVAGFSCVLFTEYSIKAMPNLYWVIWSFIVPFLVSAAVCEWLKREPKWKSAVLGAAMIGLATLVRALCGFEFVSSVMVGAELPVLWELLNVEKRKRRFWFEFAILVGVFQLVAFAMAFGMWVIQEVLYLQDWEAAKADILSTIAKRTGAFSEWVPDNEAYINSLKEPRLKVLKAYFDQKIYFNVLSLLDLVKGAVLSWVPLAIRGIWKRKLDQELVYQSRWLILALVSIAGPASWYVLASGHSAIHQSMNGFLWLFPTIPLLLSVIGGNIAVLDAMLRKDKS